MFIKDPVKQFPVSYLNAVILHFDSTADPFSVILKSLYIQLCICTEADPQTVTTITANGITIEFNRVQSASFSEKKSESGDFVSQEFESVYTDTSATATLNHRNLADTDVIILIKYSNGDIRAIGTDLAPVRCEVEDAGSPRTFRVSFRRKSPEFSKFVQSLQ